MQYNNYKNYLSTSFALLANQNKDILMYAYTNVTGKEFLTKVEGHIYSICFIYYKYYTNSGVKQLILTLKTLIESCVMVVQVQGNTVGHACAGQHVTTAQFYTMPFALMGLLLS